MEHWYCFKTIIIIKVKKCKETRTRITIIDRKSTLVERDNLIETTWFITRV